MKTLHNFVEFKASAHIKGSVLDVGGGWGRWKTQLASHATKYSISDLYDPNADFKDDARKLSNKSNSFDTVVCFEALEHIDDMDKVVSELYRVLKKGGKALVTAPFLFSRHGNLNDYWRFTPDGLVFVFQKAGFEILESGTVGNIFSVLGSFCKTKLKTYGRQGKLIKWVFIVLHGLFAKLYALFPRDNDVFFTNSYAIVEK